MGHHNTFVQVRKFAHEKLVPEIEKSIGRKIKLSDTRFYPTRRTVYTYWTYYAGGSVKACEDQAKIQEFLNNMNSSLPDEEKVYVRFEPFDPKLLAESYGITLDKTFEGLLTEEENGAGNLLVAEGTSQNVPVLPTEYFADVEEHLRPSKDSTSKQRYETAVKLLIRQCSQQYVRSKASIKPGQRTGAFYLFLQTKAMSDLYARFGDGAILFMDSGFRVNRNAFPITFISVVDNFMKGRMVGVLVSQFTDALTYSKCLSELKRGKLAMIQPKVSMTDFDTSEIMSFKSTWPDITALICTFHAVTGQNK